MATKMRSTWKVIFILLIAGVCDGISSGDEHSLHDVIFANYSSKVRPLSDFHQAVDLELDFELTGINSIDEVNQVMYTIGHIIAYWRDDYLAWDPSSYGGIDHLVVPPKEVWLPDIGIANSADTFFHSTYTTDFRVTINYTGDITWSFGGNIATLCTLDLTHFPFDKQTCSIEVENWAYPLDAVNTRHGRSNVIVDNLADNGIWHLFGSKVNTSYVYHSISTTTPFPIVTFSFQLERKPSFYLETLIIPCVLMLIVQLSVFWMPAEAGEKASLGITVLLAFTVFQLVIDENTPNTSDYSPVISTFVITIMTLSTFSTVLSIFVLYFHHKGPAARVPRCLRIFLFNYCARALCMHINVPEADNKIEDKSTWATKVEENSNRNEKSNPKSDDKKTIHSDGDDGLKSINNHLKYLVAFVKSKEKEENIVDEWKSLALVLDRILFWLVFLVSIIGLPLVLTYSDSGY